MATTRRLLTYLNHISPLQFWLARCLSTPSLRLSTSMASSSTASFQTKASKPSNSSNNNNNNDNNILPPTSPIRSELSLLPVTHHVGSTLHVSKTIGSGSVCLVLVHGADRKFQSMQHWDAHIHYLTRFGTVYAVTLPGHGDHAKLGSEREYGLQLHIDSLLSLILSSNDPHLLNCHSLILIGRSYGARVVLNTLKALQRTQKQNALHRCVLIAPAIGPDDFDSRIVSTIKTLFCWSVADRMVPLSQYDLLKKLFPIHRLETFEYQVDADKQYLQHMPENVCVNEFHAALEEWLDDGSL